MHSLEMKMPSARVMSKMRNGHKVRVSKGTGFNVMLTPNSYSQITKSFDKGKGSTLQLSGEEIMANKEVEGGALFKDIKRGFKKLGKELNKAVAPVAEKVAPIAERAVEVASPVARKVANRIIKEAQDKGVPLAKMALKEGIKQGVKIAPKALASLAIASGNPELAPVAMALGKPLSERAGKALSKQVDRIPEKKTQKPPRRSPPSIAPRTPVLPRAISMEAPAPQMIEPDYESPVISFEGQGLYAGRNAGRGLYAGRGMFGGAISYGCGYRNPKSFVSGDLSKENPALRSQPQFTNSIMRRQMGRPVGIF